MFVYVSVQIRVLYSISLCALCMVNIALKYITAINNNLWDVTAGSITGAGTVSSLPNIPSLLPLPVAETE